MDRVGIEPTTSAMLNLDNFSYSKLGVITTVVVCYVDNLSSRILFDMKNH
jgi:hypothetical protein